MSSSSSSSQLSGGAVAGTAVGSVLGVIALLAMISFYFVRKRKKNARENEAEALAISLRPVSRPRELDDLIRTVAHEKATGPQDIRDELASEPVGRIMN
ncbi:hypothetical protein N7517_010073 [Penicillium concentricum]|uniref:Uncharacterized protein n=1 Tax=Penicillium concentricum TaxID=293559 RepID=A0A9W9UXC7_9EURO|nr:uncharacterized protein N7517_010073 [Penicillium concentricum]KAJ5360882.1 hypothetical protein N7517_010073 [Penicillium concentricum]